MTVTYLIRTKCPNSRARRSCQGMCRFWELWGVIWRGEIF